MTEQVISPAPGVCYNQSYYASGKSVAYVTEGIAFRQGQNRYTDGYNIEFISGSPQKVAGWAQATPTLTNGLPRAICVWRGSDGTPLVGIGTDTHLYYLQNKTLTDITPVVYVATGTLTNPISTTINSNLVQIADTAARLNVNDLVYLSAATAVGGIVVKGWYAVLSPNPGTGYTIQASTSATASATSGGGATTYKYPRATVTNPFATVSGLAQVIVTHTAHGAQVGSFVIYSGATDIGGLTLNGEFQVSSVIDANHYTITAPSNATSTVVSGGGSVSVIYLVLVQQAVPSPPTAYGDANFGVAAYSGSGIYSTPPLPNGWTLSAYGNQLLACPIGGSIYIYDSVRGGRAYPMDNAPAHVNAMFVTPERFVVALGLGGNNQMMLSWCDQNDYTIWTTDNLNTANTGRTLVGGSYLVGGLAVRPGQSLIWSDRAVFAMTYTGGQNIYSTLMIADNCGLLNPYAACCGGGVAFWMSDQDFWTWNGAATALPSDDIRAKVFSNLNRAQFMKCCAVTNRTKKQVRFYYPSGNSVENNLGMIYSYDSNAWSPLAFGRSGASDANLLPSPVSADITGMIFFDEVGVDANGAPLPYFLQLGMMDIANGERSADIFGFTPDFLYLAGSPDLNILTQYYPLQALTVDGPYTMTTKTTRIDLRSDGKLFSFSIGDTDLGCNFRLGLPRLDIGVAGARR